MIFQGFKETILKRQLDKILSESNSSGDSSLKKIKSVGIITSEKTMTVIDLQKQIEGVLKFRNTKMYSLRKFDKTADFSFEHFTEKDINWKGQFIQENIQSFLEQPFDLLIGYFNTNNIFLESAILQSKAQFKVGFAGVNSMLYEIEISEKTENVSAFTLELKKYLKIIKKL
jgi:hypothetical protein